jgi:DNA-binding transcriptional ArsR family regulator
MMPAPPVEMDLGLVLAALADPWRRRVVLALLAGPDGCERTCSSFELPLSKSTLTHHFRILREAGLISDADYGNRRGVSLRREELERRFPGLLDLLTDEAARQAPEHSSSS